MEEYLDASHLYNLNSNNNASNITNFNVRQYISNNELQNLLSNNSYNNNTNEILTNTQNLYGINEQFVTEDENNNLYNYSYSNYNNNKLNEGKDFINNSSLPDEWFRSNDSNQIPNNNIFMSSQNDTVIDYNKDFNNNFNYNSLYQVQNHSPKILDNNNNNMNAFDYNINELIKNQEPNFNDNNDNILIGQNDLNNINQNNILNQFNPYNSEEQNIKISPPPIKVVLNDSDFKDIINKEVGIINLGNTCFINSCLQILIHCPNFIYKFFEKKKLFNKDDTPISFYLNEICYSMVDTINTNASYVDITDFKNAFGEKHPAYQGYIQNDSQEFCRVLLEDINTELNEVKTQSEYKELPNSDKKTKAERDEEFDLNFQEREKSIITELFYAQIISTFICECESTTYSFQKILDFPLLLPENTPNIDIKELLKNYFKSEKIDFEIKCEKCEKVLQHTKEIKISRPPEILILSLQRIDQTTQKKNECLVTFPPILDMSEFIDKDCGFDKEPMYNLFAIVNHSGNIDFGHYNSYIKFKDSEDFYDFNDSVVTNIGKDIDSFPNAYALFYVKNKNYKNIKQK